jgi:hypothetical protein
MTEVLGSAPGVIPPVHCQRVPASRVHSVQIDLVFLSILFYYSLQPRKLLEPRPPCAAKANKKFP